MSQKTLITTPADYGLDAPTLVQKFLLGGGALAIAGLGILIWSILLQGNSRYYRYLNRCSGVDLGGRFFILRHNDDLE
jgi:hypothetical protein